MTLLLCKKHPYARLRRFNRFHGVGFFDHGIKTDPTIVKGILLCATCILQELIQMLEEEELKDAALLVFANKQDLSGAYTAAQISEALVCIYYTLTICIRHVCGCLYAYITR